MQRENRLSEPPSGPGDGPHRIQPDDDRRPRIQRQLVADVATAQELPHQRALASREPDEDASAAQVDGRDVVLGAIDPEPTTQLVHRHVRTALDEAAELWRGASDAGRWP